MKELYVEGVVTRNDHASCGRHRKVSLEALTVAPVGLAMEPRKQIPEADPVPVAGRQNVVDRHREVHSAPAGSSETISPGTAGLWPA